MAYSQPNTYKIVNNNISITAKVNLELRPGKDEYLTVRHQNGASISTMTHEFDDLAVVNIQYDEASRLTTAYVGRADGPRSLGDSITFDSYTPIVVEKTVKGSSMRELYEVDTDTFKLIAYNGPRPWEEVILEFALGSDEVEFEDAGLSQDLRHNCISTKLTRSDIYTLLMLRQLHKLLREQQVDKSKFELAAEFLPTIEGSGPLETFTDPLRFTVESNFILVTGFSKYHASGFRAETTALESYFPPMENSTQK